jgi:hypothetical protein
MSKEDRQYRKLQKKHKKSLMYLAKRDADFDWQFLHDLVCQKIKNMREFYQKGFGVVQSEESRREVLESLDVACGMIDEICHCWDEYTEILMERCKKCSPLEVNLTDKEKELREKSSEREIELYKDFYKYIGEHIFNWWD